MLLMNKISTAILLVLVLIVGATCIYELVCIQEFRQDLVQISTDIQQLEDDNRSLNRDVQDMAYDIKTINKTLDHILARLWLTRPPMPENNRPIPAAKEK